MHVFRRGGRDDDGCARGHFVQATAHFRKEKVCTAPVQLLFFCAACASLCVK